MKSKIVYLNGDYVAPEKATISVFDRGFLFSDSVYEVIQVCENKLFLFDEHLSRLRRSLKELNISEPALDWLGICKKLLSYENRVELGGIYLQISRGVQGQRSHFWTGQKLNPTVVAFLQILQPSQKKTLKVITYPDFRWGRCDIKSTSLLANVLAREEAARRDCDEAVLEGPDGRVTEGSSTNLFVVKNGSVKTAGLDSNILGGVTRNFCVEILSQLGVRLEEVVPLKSELLSADEVWLTSSTKDLALVTQVNDVIIGSNKKFPIYDLVSSEFQKQKVAILEEASY